MAKSSQTTLEKQLWEMFRDGVKPLGAHPQRIESSSTGWGIPDVNCAYKGTEFWAELKIIRGGKIKFEKGQPGWLHKRWKAGCLSWVLARKLTNEVDQILVWRGHDAIKLSKVGVSELKPFFSASKIRHRGSFDWQTILECMCEIKKLIIEYHDLFETWGNVYTELNELGVELY